jgi:transglutaminase-like putative cysteine protease
MFLEIRHVTQYLYAAPVRESVMELRLQPQKSARQRLISFDLELDPTAKLFSYVDAYGNAVYHFDQPQPHERLTIVSKAAVETEPPPTLPEALDMGEWDRLRSQFVQGEWFDFLYPHGFARCTPRLAEFMRTHGLDGARLRDPLTAVRRLSGALYEALAYDNSVTEADSPIDHALEAGSGVCQDFAHIMIAICRSWGVPARYVSGYLFTDRLHASDRSSPDATHAWVEVFLPSLRWVGFDPTNNILTGERHVVVAVGRDYGDVPPSRGVFKGEAESELAVAVSVRQARSAAAEPEFMRLQRPSFSSASHRRAPTEGFDKQLQQQQQQQQQQ